MKKVFLIIIGLLFLYCSSPAIAKSKNTDELRIQAITLQFNKKYQEAIKIYNEIIAKDPKDERAYSGRGDCFYDLKNYQRAIKDYSVAIQINQNQKYSNYYQNRAKVYVALGDNQRAIEDYNKAIEINPNDPDNYCKRGRIYASLKEYKRAIQDYDKSLEIIPDTYLSNILGSNPKDKNVYYYERGFIYDELGDYQRAIDDYSKAIELKPDPDYYYVRGLAYCELALTGGSSGDYQKAIDDYSKAIELKPDKPKYSLRGKAYYDLEDFQKAFQDFTKAIEINPKDAEALKYLALLKHREDNTLRLVCKISSEELSGADDLFLEVDLAEKTVNGHPANITESVISWTVKNLKATLNRYTGQLILTSTGTTWRRKCQKASEKQF